MKHYGDITKIKGPDVPLVDIVCGGSPCQDLSVAGKRAGLDGERSGLFMEQIRIIKEMRNESIKQLSMRGAAYTWGDIRPRYMVWENVPGAFSSNKGQDFKAVLEETAKIAEENAVIPGLEGGAKWTPSGCIMGNGWSIAWRVHDAQFWGVPQRRKRIALVADFGGSTAPEILFERKSVSGDSEESGEAWQDTSGNIKKCAGDAIGVDAYNQSVTGQVSKSITCSATDSDHVPSVFCIQGNCIDRADTAGCNGKGWREDESYTLNTIDRHAVCFSQDAYDKWSESDKSATIKQTGGSYGGGERSNRNPGCDRSADGKWLSETRNEGSNEWDVCCAETVGALCRVDYKGAGNQYVSEGKCIIQRIE